MPRKSKSLAFSDSNFPSSLEDSSVESGEHVMVLEQIYFFCHTGSQS